MNAVDALEVQSTTPTPIATPRATATVVLSSTDLITTTTTPTATLAPPFSSETFDESQQEQW